MTITRDSVHDFDPVRPMSEPPDGGSAFVGTVGLPDGRRQAVIVPRAVGRLTGSAKVALGDLQDAALAVQQAQADLSEAVEVARLEGLSWNVVGWCLGVSAQAASKRFAEREDVD